MNKQPKASFKIVAFAAFLWFVAGCASTSTPTPSTPSLLGTWVGTVTEENALVIAGEKKGMGQHELTFSDNGRVSIFWVGVGMEGEATYILTQDKIVFTEENGSCVNARFPSATYKWSVENDSLTLTPIDDGCYYRRKTMGGERFWIRKTTDGTAVPTIAPKLK